MGVETTIADDYLLIDGLETVTLKVRTAEGTFTDYASCKAYRHTLDKLVEQGGGLLRQTVTTWRIPKKPLTTASVPTTSPKYQDVLQQASGVQWFLESSDLDELGVEYVCQARRVPTATG